MQYSALFWIISCALQASTYSYRWPGWYLCYLLSSRFLVQNLHHILSAHCLIALSAANSPKAAATLSRRYIRLVCAADINSVPAVISFDTVFKAMALVSSSFWMCSCVQCGSQRWQRQRLRFWWRRCDEWKQRHESKAIRQSIVHTSKQWKQCHSPFYSAYIKAVASGCYPEQIFTEIKNIVHSVSVCVIFSRWEVFIRCWWKCKGTRADCIFLFPL